MDVEQLRIVLAVAQHGSFTRAARGLFMSQSSVSRQVANLERALGTLLFCRRPHEVQITPAGAAFLPHAQRVVEAADLAVTAAREAWAPANGAAPPNPREGSAT